MKSALIFGIHGMDGSHLADFLLKKEYKVFGVEHREDIHNTNTIHLRDKVIFLKGSLQDQNSILNCIEQSNPDEIYNLGGRSFLNDCWLDTENNADIMGLGVLRLLESVKLYNKNIKVFQASSSEMYGGHTVDLIDERFCLLPKTQYGCSKAYAHMLCKHYRDTYNMFVCCGILFNHESERRKSVFLSRKITKNVVDVFLKKIDSFSLGNINTRRDWSYAPDFVEAFWLMLQHSTPDDYILSSGKLNTIKDFLYHAFLTLGIEDWEKHITIDKNLYRPSESNAIAGNNYKAKSTLNWMPKTSFVDFIKIMINNDLKHEQ